MYFSFLSFQIISQENILELDCVQTEYFYSSGELSSKGCLINGNPNGEWKSYYKSGIIKSEGFWNNNKLSGKKAKPAADDGGIIKKRSTAR